MRTQTTLMIAALSASLAATGACRGNADAPAANAAPPPASASAPASISVTAVDVGRTLNPDKSIGDKTATFKPADTIYVAVATGGTSSGATLTARFTYGSDGQLVKEESRQIAPSGAAVTEFHIAKPDG